MPRLPKRVKRHLRQELYYAAKYGLLNHLEKIGIQEPLSYIRRIDGLIAFMYSVEPKCAHNFDIIWQEILLKLKCPQSRNPSKLLKKYQLQKGFNDPSLLEQSAQEVKLPK